MMAMLWAQEIMSAETEEEAKALYERCPRLLKEKVKAILPQSHEYCHRLCQGHGRNRSQSCCFDR